MQPTALTTETVDVMPGISKILIVYGPLGVLTLIAIYVAAKLYKDMQVAAKQYALDLKAERIACDLERANHTKELDGLRDRYIEKADTWNSKYHELSDAQNKVLESVFKSRSRSDSNQR